MYWTLGAWRPEDAGFCGNETQDPDGWVKAPAVRVFFFAMRISRLAVFNACINRWQINSSNREYNHGQCNVRRE
jgi:hypothetical protein